MKALSVHQPWAWAILHAGKCIENRTWATRHRGPLLIHASKSKGSYKAQAGIDWRATYGVELPEWDSLATGAIVGVVEVLACLALEPWKRWQAEGSPSAMYGEAMASPWVEGPWCWVLANPRPLAVPVPCRGLQMLFKVPGEWA